MRAKIVIADDHATTRLGVRTLLEQVPGCTVVGEADNGRAAVELCKELQPDLVLIDLVMPVLNGIDATRLIVSECPTSSVIMFSMHPDRKYVDDAMSAGARGYIMKDDAVEQIKQAINTVLQGRIFVSPSVTGAGESIGKVPRLTPRERQVLQLIAEGHSTKQVAVQLKIGTKTIETHRRQIMEKLGLDNVAELTKYAIREGITNLR